MLCREWSDKSVDKIRELSGNGDAIICEGLKALLQTTGDLNLIKPVITPYHEKGRYQYRPFFVP